MLIYTLKLRTMIPSPACGAGEWARRIKAPAGDAATATRLGRVTVQRLLVSTVKTLSPIPLPRAGEESVRNISH